MNFLAKIFLASHGYKRAIAIAILVLSHAADLVPALAPYKEILITIGAAFGVTGIAHAVVADDR